MDFHFYVKEVHVHRPPAQEQSCTSVGVGVRLLDFPVVLIGVFSSSQDMAGEHLVFLCNRGKSCRFRMERDLICELLKREKNPIEISVTDSSRNPARLVATGYLSDRDLPDKLSERSLFNSKVPVVEKKYLVPTTNKCGDGHGYVILKLKVFARQLPSAFHKEECAFPVDSEATHMTRVHGSSSPVTSVSAVSAPSADPCPGKGVTRKRYVPGHWIPPPLHFKSQGLPVAGHCGHDVANVVAVERETDLVSAQHWAVLMADGCKSWPLEFLSESFPPSKSSASVCIQTEPLSQVLLPKFPVLSALYSELEVLKRAVDSSSIVTTDTVHQAVQTEPQGEQVEPVIPTPVKTESQNKVKRPVFRRFIRSCCCQSVGSPRHLAFPMTHSRPPSSGRRKQRKQATSTQNRQRVGGIAISAKNTIPTVPVVKGPPRPGQVKKHPLEKRMMPPPHPCAQKDEEMSGEPRALKHEESSKESSEQSSYEGSSHESRGGLSGSGSIQCTKSAVTGIMIIPPSQSSSPSSLQSTYTGSQPLSQMPWFKMSTDSLDSTGLVKDLLHPRQALHGQVYLAASSQSADGTDKNSSPGSVTDGLSSDHEKNTSLQAVARLLLKEQNMLADKSASHSSCDPSDSSDLSLSYSDDFESDETTT